MRARHVNENRQLNGSCHPGPLSALLIEAPAGRHFAQLHRRSEALTRAVGQFVETGHRRGNGVVVIASALHTEELFDRLAEKRIDLGSFLRCGQLVLRDAEAMLDTIMRGECRTAERSHGLRRPTARNRAFPPAETQLAERPVRVLRIVTNDRPASSSCVRPVLAAASASAIAPELIPRRK